MLKMQIKELVVQAVKVKSFADVVEKLAYIVALAFAFGVLWLVFNLMGWWGMIALVGVFLVLTLLKIIFIWLM